MNEKRPSPNDIFDTRVRPRDVLRLLLLPLWLLWIALRSIVPPTRGSANCIWEEAERVRIRCHAPDPTASLFPELSAAGSGNAEGKTVIPSREKLFKHLRMVWVVRTIAFCAVVGMLCVLTALALSLLRVKTVAFSGNVRYSDAALTEYAGIREGDELYAFRPAEVAEMLKKECPYLSSVSVSRSVNGTVLITVAEREPVWRITVGSRTFLFDTDLTLLEIGAADAFSGYPALLVSTVSEGMPAVGDILQISGEESTLLTAFAGAMQTMQETAGVLLDISDRYRIRLCLRDGSVILFSGNDNPAGSLSAVLASVSHYREETGDIRPLTVSVGENGSISLSVRSADDDSAP